MSTPSTGGRRQFDMTVNVQSLLMSVFGAAVGAIVMWYSLVGRVQTLEDHVKQLEAAFVQQRSDMKESLRDIGQSVKDTNAKIDQLTQQLYQSSAGARPDTRRWAR